MDMLRRNFWRNIINGFVITVVVLTMVAQIRAQDVIVTSAPQPPIAKSQQPVATPRPLNAITESDGSGRERTPPLTDRERMLLERIEQLERRLIEVESRVGLTSSADKKAAESILPPAEQSPTPSTSSPQPKSAAVPGTVASQSQPIPAGTPPARQQNPEPWDKGGVKIIPYGILVAGAAYNTYGLVPGSIAFFAVPRLPVTGRQFSVSAGNTFVGFDIIGPKIGDWAINGKFDFNLRGPTPVTDDNVFAPYFANVFIEGETEHNRLL